MASEVGIVIDGQQVMVVAGRTILQVADELGVYIPRLCAHPDLPAAGVCGLCLVECAGRIVQACETPVQEGMVVNTSTSEVQARRRQHLAVILARHPHACLTCAQREGCSRTQCSSNVPPEERCCELLGLCELGQVAEYIGIPPDLPRYTWRGLPTETDALFSRDYNLCVSCTRCVRYCREVRGVGALQVVYRGGEATVGWSTPEGSQANCRFCGACLEVCPTGAIKERAQWPRADVAPCSAACPAGIDVPAYVRAIAKEDFARAALIIRQRIPFPGVLGRVCFHPCEAACWRVKLNEAVAIRRLKRFAADYDPGVEGLRGRPAVRQEKIAVVGAGPAGLTAAYFLAWAGYQVTVFDALPQAGGMLRAGIPEFRLPREVVEREITEICRLGVDIRLGHPVRTLADLPAGDYAAVILALGATEELKLGFPGEELPGVIPGVAFLRQVNLGEQVEVTGRVAVIGGGNVAVDVARTCLRLGAGAVDVIYRRRQAEMPAFGEEVEEAEHEGVRFRFLLVPVAIHQNDSGLAVELVQVQPGEVDQSGRHRPVPVAGSNFQENYDRVIVAIGQKPGRLEEQEDNGRLVFRCGDMVSGPASVVEAVASGREAAQAVHLYLTGEELPIPQVAVAPLDPRLGPAEGFAGLRRVHGFKRPWQSRDARCVDYAERRLMCFQEVEQGFDEFLAVEEAGRCLQCDLRLTIGSNPLPPAAIDREVFSEEGIARVPETAGVFQLLDDGGQVIYICGIANLRQGLENSLHGGEFVQARYFMWEEDPMYTKRESELLQRFLQQHGQFPSGNDVLDDELF